MGINTAIFDISGTTLKDDGSVQDKFWTLVKFLEENEIKIVFTTNQIRQKRLLVRSGLPYDLLVSPEEVYVKKPSPAYIDYAVNKLRTTFNKCIYIGDTDATDAYCAAHRKLLYFSAHWSNPRAKYGIKISSPTGLIKYIGKFLLKDKFWGWEYSNKDENDFDVECKTLFDSHNSGLKKYAVAALKNNNIKYVRFFANHFLSSIYLSKLFNKIDIWCTYPSHNMGNSINKTLQGMIKVATEESRQLYLDLFVRHKDAKDSGKSRYLGTNVDFNNQLSTVNLNPAFKDKIKGKTILLVDDFITKGYSNECGRNLLYQAGAELVISVACGKYGDEYKQISIEEIFDPFNVIDPEVLTITTKSVRGNFYKDVDKQILETLD